MQTLHEAPHAGRREGQTRFPWEEEQDEQGRYTPGPMRLPYTRLQTPNPRVASSERPARQRRWTIEERQGLPVRRQAPVESMLLETRPRPDDEGQGRDSYDLVTRGSRKAATRGDDSSKVHKAPS